MKTNTQLLGATPNTPYHVSVGILLLNKESNIICLHYAAIDELLNIYTLPQKTLKIGETIENAVKRAARQETGSEISISAYLGSIVVKDRWWGELNAIKEVEKTTLYFLAQQESLRYIDEATAQNEAEKRTLCEVSFNKLLDIFTKQQEKDGMRGFNQLEIVRRAKQHLDACT